MQTVLIHFKMSFIPMMAKLKHHYSSLQCQWSFRNHSNMPIFCSRKISYYHQCWKQMCSCLSFFL